MPWRRAKFKGSKVWAEVGEDGELAVTSGRVSIRYSDKAGAKLYGAGVSRVALLDGHARELEAGEEAAPAKPKASRGSGFGSAGTRTAAQAAAAASAAADLIAGLPEGTAIAFTDGGCRGNPGPSGSGVYLELPDGRRAAASRALGRGTNNIAELTALDMALDLLDEAAWPSDAPAALLTDSRYAKGVLVDGWKAKANQALILPLRERLKARPGAVLHWVAGHAGVAGNERADALANAGIEGRSAVSWSGEGSEGLA